MSYFDQVYQQLFDKKSEKSEVLIYEVIERNKRYKADYLHWVKSDDFKKLSLDIFSSLELKKDAIDKTPMVHLLNSRNANGFAISYHKEIRKTDFQYFFDWLSDRTQTLDYQLKNSDVTVTKKNEIVETREKHYLKPRVKNEEVLDQQYGNILIEHILINDVPSYIKYTANSYSDRKYQEVQNFDKLAEYLFQDLIL
ncbi:MAG: hypothetical protein ACFHWX_14640 [Bacteroidota bacterium]